MVEKNVAISSSMSSRIIEFLSSYNGEDLKFKYLKNVNPLKAVFQVYTSETDNEKLVRRIKDLIKSTPFGSVLYFSVTVE